MTKKNWQFYLQSGNPHCSGKFCFVIFFSLFVFFIRKDQGLSLGVIWVYYIENATNIQFVFPSEDANLHKMESENKGKAVTMHYSPPKKQHIFMLWEIRNVFFYISSRV